MEYYSMLCNMSRGNGMEKLRIGGAGDGVDGVDGVDGREGAALGGRVKLFD